MFQNFRRGGTVLVLTALLLSMSLPAYALFDLDDPASGDSPLPIAENLTLTTYKNVAVEGTLAAVDPDGEGVTFRITKNPARGAVTQGSEGSAKFTYTPYEDKLGKDSFTYVAEDASGNVSQPALVSIKITRPGTKVTYSDMSGHAAHKAAIALAEEEVFVGEQMGQTWFFRPEAQVTREEFLAMAMDLVGLETLPEARMTGFSDDDSISVWARPYVASALRSGMIQGATYGEEGASFAPARTITGTEAAVLLDRLLRVSDVADTGKLTGQAAPVWAHQSVVNLEAVGVLEGSADLAGDLTRAQAAELLLSAMEVLDFREGIW
ncbi:MAG: S-layer homology domain-containing protein [Ruminiclostridium sp.]|nr:S-layer homology domain-containing protein [Ruminiclostridium sp.]